MSNVLLPNNPDLLEVLERDLIHKIKDSVSKAGLGGNVYGVFSLDDLETKSAEDFCGGVAFGVGYQGTKPVTENAGQINTAKTGALQTCEVLFLVLVAAPMDEMCSKRLTGMKLLTILRQGIMGSSVSAVPGEPAGRNEVQRSWAFVGERPEVSESTSTMLYYTQQWRIVLPMKGN